MFLDILRQMLGLLVPIGLPILFGFYILKPDFIVRIFNFLADIGGNFVGKVKK